MAPARFEDPNSRPTKPLPDISGSCSDRNRRRQYTGICGYPEEAEYHRTAESDILGRVQLSLPPHPGLLMLGETRNCGVKQQIDVNDDHGRCPAESIIAASSSASARRLKPARSNTGRT